MKIQHPGKNERGFVVALVLLGIVVLSFYLVSSHLSTKTSVQIAGNYGRTVDTFNTAEVGLAKARTLIEGQDFDSLLSTYGPDNALIEEVEIHDGYTIEVYLIDNDDGDGDPAGDDDNIVILTSIGRNPAGGKVEIETYLQKMDASEPIGFPGSPGVGPSAALLCGENSEIKVWGSADVSGCDWSLEYPPVKDCTDGGPAIVGVADIDETTKTGSLEAGNGANTMEENIGEEEANCSDWRTLRNQLASLSDSAPGVNVITSGPVTSSLNSCADPQIFIVNTTEESIMFSGNGILCGILVVASNTVIQTTGGYSLIGLVLVMGEDADLSLDMSVGQSSVLGQVIVDSMSVDRDLEMDVQGTADVMLSTEALAKAAEAMAYADPGGGGGSGALITVSWKETY